MSALERPDTVAFHELESLVRGLVDEVARFRKRALAAEAKLKGYESAAGTGAKTGARLAELEAENLRLRSQVAAARTTSKGMMERVRFLRQQAQSVEK